MISIMILKSAMTLKKKTNKQYEKEKSQGKKRYRLRELEQEETKKEIQEYATK